LQVKVEKKALYFSLVVIFYKKCTYKD